MTSKKLLVLDVNGLLVDTYFYKEPLPEESPDARVGNFYVYKRPFCEEFLRFCLENFMVGIWSSAREYNVNNLVDYVFGGTKERLAFSWHQSDCTDLGLKSPDNQRKPLFLKELSKLWRKVKVDLPWSEGNYGPSNTLLVDDTPYKAILNPPNTAIFPRSYTARDHGDNFLGGALRRYLEGIRDAASVQTYVESNPFGEPSITPGSPLWSYVNEVVLQVKNVLNKVSDGVALIMPVEGPSEEGNKEDKPKRWQNGKWKHHSDPLQPVEVVTDEDNKENKRKRRRSKKQKYHSDPSQLANNHLQSSDFDFPSEAVESHFSELQSSDHVLQLLGSGVQVHDSNAYEQTHGLANPGSQERVHMSIDQTDEGRNSNQSLKEHERPSQLGKSVSSPSRLEKPSKGEHHDTSRLFPKLGNCDRDCDERCENTVFVPSPEQGRHLALEAANHAASVHEGIKRTDKEHEEENQVILDENHGPFDKQGYIKERDSHTGIDAELDSLHGQHCDDGHGNIDGEGNESFEKTHIPVGNDNLVSLKPYGIQANSKSEGFFSGTRNNISVDVSNNSHASQRHLIYSNRRRHKLRGTWEDLNKRNSHRNDTNRRSFGYGQGWMDEGAYCQGQRTQMPFSKHLDERGHHSANKQHMQYVDRHSGKEYRNKVRPPFGNARHSHQRWGNRPPAWSEIPDRRSWDHSQQYCRQFSNTKSPTNASFGVLDSNVSTWPFSSQGGSAARGRKHNEYRRDQDWHPSSYSWHQGYEQGASERTELHVNVHYPDNNLAVQAESRGLGRRQRLDFESEQAAASSQPHEAYRASRRPYQNVGDSSKPYRKAGAFSQPYKRHHVGSRESCQDVGASSQPYHNSWDKCWQHPGGFSRSRG